VIGSKLFGGTDGDLDTADHRITINTQPVELAAVQSRLKDGLTRIGMVAPAVLAGR